MSHRRAQPGRVRTRNLTIASWAPYKSSARSLSARSNVRQRSEFRRFHRDPHLESKTGLSFYVYLSTCNEQSRICQFTSGSREEVCSTGLCTKCLRTSARIDGPVSHRPHRSSTARAAGRTPSGPSRCVAPRACAFEVLGRQGARLHRIYGCCEYHGASYAGEPFALLACPNTCKAN